MMRASHPEGRTPTFRRFGMVMVAVTWFAVLLPVGARAAGTLMTLVGSSWRPALTTPECGWAPPVLPGHAG